MATLYCTRCSRVISVNGSPPRSCPDCGFTFGNAADSTHTGDPLGALPETISEILRSPPTTIGRYQIRSELGCGGFGTVDLAYDPKLDRLVAIKTPNERSRRKPDFVERFAREGRNAAQLKHPGIVTVYDVEDNGEGVFLVTEYVPGEPLSKLLKRGRLPFRTAASIVAAVASAAQFAHSKKIIHRDIKPSNVMIDEAGNPRLMDFGLAKREDIDETVTVDNQILGTLAYMSPEQSIGNAAEIDHRTDIYSLGVTLYQLLTGQLPFHGDSKSLRQRVRTDEPIRPRNIDKQIPIDLETICLKAMEKKRELRYQTAGELAEDLERWLRGEPIVARHIGRPERAWRWAKRNPASAGLIASITLVLAVSAAGAAAVAAVAEQGRKEAEQGRKEATVLKDKETDARQVAEAALSAARASLSKQYIERAGRYQQVRRSPDDYNPMKALPLLAAARDLDKDNPERNLSARIRLQTQLDLAPSIERMWFHQEIVNAAGLSPRNDLFFTAGEDGMVHIWRISDDRAPVVSLSHPSRVLAAAFTPDGAVLATGTKEGLRIWEVATGKMRNFFAPQRVVRRRADRFPDSSESIHQIAMGKTGRLVFAHFGLNGGQIWDVSTGRSQGAPISRPSTLTAAKFAANDELLLLGQLDGSICVWDVQKSSQHRAFAPSGKGGARIDVAPDGTTVVLMTGGKNAILWNAVTNQQTEMPLSLDSHSVTSLDFSPNGEYLAVGSVEGTVELWSVRASSLVWRQQVLTHAINRLCFSADGANLCCQNSNRCISFLDVQTGKFIAQPIVAKNSISIDWIKGARQILAVNGEGITRLWNVDIGVPAFGILDCRDVERATVSANRQVVAAVDSKRRCRILRKNPGGNFETENVKAVPLGLDEGITAIALSSNGSRLAVAAQRNVSIWDTTSRELIVDQLPHSHDVQQMRFTPDGQHLVCATYDGKTTVWNSTTGRRLYEPLNLATEPGDVTDLDVDRDGNQAIAAIRRLKSQASVWEIRSGKLKTIPLSAGEFVRFLGPSGTAMVASIDGKIAVWDLAAARQLVALDTEPRLTCLDVSDNGNQLLTGNLSGRARVWSIALRGPASPPMEHATGVRLVRIAPSGKWAATVDAESRLRVWNARTGEMLFACTADELDSQFSKLTARQSDRDRMPAVFFSSNERSLHLLTKGGVFVTISLEPPDRPLDEIKADIALRSGAEFDAGEGLTTLTAGELSQIWKKGLVIPRRATQASIAVPAGAADPPNKITARKDK